jgi:hypothetical protein
MSKLGSPPSGGPKVSKVRTIVSLVLLLVVGVVCVIELRAGVGHWMTTRALKAKCNDVGEFQNLSLEEAQSLIRFSTSVKQETTFADVTFRYGWYSLLRPLMGEENPGLTLVASGGEKAMALSFHTDSEQDPDSPSPVPGPARGGNTTSPDAPGGPGDMPAGMMPGGMMPGGMMPPGMMPGGPGGPGSSGGGQGMRPPLDDDVSEKPETTDGVASDKPADQPAGDQPDAGKPTEEKPADSPADNSAEPAAAPN